MTNPRVTQGRTLSQIDIEHIRDLLGENPQWSRYRLSKVLSQEWDWRTANGQLKDMATRNLLVQLDKRGMITLPARRCEAIKRRGQPSGFKNVLAPPPITESLAALMPLNIELMTMGSPDHATFSRYLARYHYLGYRGCVGENMFYLVRDRTGRDLACVLFSAAAWKTQPRDTFIGWDHIMRSRHLAFVTNNTRFLILPWVHVPHLASHLLGRLLRRLNNDWCVKYNHPVHLIETFVERNRFKGTCYRAANWVCVGQTKGRSRNDRYSTLKVPIKDIYLYPLTTDFREKLCHANA
jgi:hypothetical protein